MVVGTTCCCCRCHHEARDGEVFEEQPWKHRGNSPPSPPSIDRADDCRVVGTPVALSHAILRCCAHSRSWSLAVPHSESDCCRRRLKYERASLCHAEPVRKAAQQLADGSAGVERRRHVLRRIGHVELTSASPPPATCASTKFTRRDCHFVLWRLLVAWAILCCVHGDHGFGRHSR